MTERNNRPAGRSTGETRDREDPPAPKRKKGNAWADEEAVSDSEPEPRELEVQEGVAANTRLIRALVNQIDDLRKTIGKRSSEEEGKLKGGIPE